MGLKYVGPDVTLDPEIVYKDFVSGVKSADLSTAAIDTAIDSGLSSYATKAYVDTQDGLLVPQSYIDAQDNLRVRLSAKDVNNGVAGLDTTGKVAPARINAPLTQRYVRGPWTPAAYNVTDITSSGADAALYQCTITDPGYPYKLITHGIADCLSLNNETPIVQVRVGSATGEIIATGSGGADAFGAGLIGDDFNRADSTEAVGLGPNWEARYTDGAGVVNGNPGHGWVAIYQNQAAWYDGGNLEHIWRGRNIGANSRLSATNFQKISATMANVGESQAQPNQWFRFYARVNDAFTTYVALEQTFGQARWLYANGGAEVYLTDYFASTLVANQVTAIQTGDPANPRRFQLFQNGALVNTFNDNTAVTALGATFRGWGMGFRAVNRGFGQSTPPFINDIYIADNVNNYTPVQVLPQGLATQTVKTGPTTLYVRLNRLAAGQVSASPYRPNLHVLAVAA